MITIGIDPGKETGFAVYDHLEKRLIVLDTVDFWTAYSWTLYYWRRRTIRCVVIEVPSNKHVFHKPGANAAANQRMGVHVGSVIREAELLAIGIELNGINVKRVEPVGKRDAAAFKEAFPEWTGRSNQHNRDAAFMTLRRCPE